MEPSASLRSWGWISQVLYLFSKEPQGQESEEPPFLNPFAAVHGWMWMP